MGRTYSRCISALAIICLAFALVSVTAVDTADATEVKASRAPNHGVLIIENETALAAAASSGNGSATNPYVIEGYEIDANGTSVCILIAYTESYAIVRDCTLYNATTGTSGINPGAGIGLYNAKNVTLQDNNCSNNRIGISVVSSNNNTLMNNTCGNCYYYGIHLYQSYAIDIMSNDLKANTFGIFMAGANANTIRNNTCNENHIYGISLDFCYNNTIDNNTCSNNDDCGIFTCDYSSNNTISRNDCLWNGGSGIQVKDGWCNIVSDNVCMNNSASGINVIFSQITSTNNLITGNHLCGNTAGYSAFYGDFCIISGNDIHDNDYGMDLWYSHNNTISDNTVYGSSAYGIRLRTSHGNAISNNTAEGSSSFGIALYHTYSESDRSVNNTVIGNILRNNNGASSIYSASHAQAYDSGVNTWNTTAYGNYWSDQMSPDNDTDGIVDVPYVIDGDTNDSFPLALYVSVTSPSSILVFTNSTSCTLSGIASAYDGIASVTWYNVDTGAYGVCTGTTAWSGTVTVEGVDGETNTIIITMMDVFGHECNDSVTVFYDITDPVSLKISAPEDGSSVGSSSVRVLWTGNDGSTPIGHYLVFLDGEQVMSSSNLVSYMFEGLSNGEHTVIVRLYDPAGNWISDSVTFTVDATAPVVKITSPENSKYYDDGDMTVSWTASDALSGLASVGMSVDGGASIDVTGLVSYALTGLADGEHTVEITAVDEAGNARTVSVTFTVDTVAPSLTVTSPDDGSYDTDGNVTVDWEAFDVTSGIKTCSVSVVGRLSMFLTNGTSYTFTDLGEGTFTVNITAIDNVGNSNTRSVTFTIDTIAPTATTSPTGEGVLLNATISAVFSETMDISATTIMVEGVNGALTWSGNTFVFVPSSLTYNQTYTVNVTGHDLAGNVVRTSWTFSTLKVGDITGVLLDKSGNALANTTVRLSNGMTVVTDANGTFLFEDVPTGEYELTVDGDGYEDVVVGVTVTSEGTTDLGLMQAETEADLTLTISVVLVLVIVFAGGAFVFYRTKGRM